MYVAASIAFVYILAGTFFYSLAKVAGRADQHSARRAIALQSGTSQESQDRVTVV